MTQSLGAARRVIAARLTVAGFDNADIEARALAEVVTGLDAAAQAAAPERPLAAEENSRLDDLARRRIAGEPLQHITGRAAFWTLELKSDARALVPRADTETVVEAALSRLPDGRPTRVLDLGVGSGAILLAILHERPLARGVGLDASADALALAQENAALTGLADRISFTHGGWEAALPLAEGAPFDLIVSNPPYIPRADIAGLAPDVRRDPLAALDGGPDGLDAYRAILPLLPRLLPPGAPAVLEIGWDQAASVSALAESAPGLVLETVRHDLEDRPRALVFRTRL